MNVLVFPGQGAQYPGMASDLPLDRDEVKQAFATAKEILGYDLLAAMTDADADELKQTHIAQPALYVHSLIRLNAAEALPSVDAVAGHSLGELTALACAKVYDFATGLQLVRDRSLAMKSACDQVGGTMAAVLGLDDDVVEQVCAQIDGVVVAANYNSPGQIVISGEIDAIDAASEVLSDKGARKVVPLVVGGAFHSPLMEPARKQLAESIEATVFNPPSCPVYQNVHGQAVTDPAELKNNLIAQLTAPVKWSQSMQQMISDGADHIYEVGGNGKVLRGLFKRIDRNLTSDII